MQWRPALGIAIFVAAMLVSCIPAFWERRLLVAWDRLQAVPKGQYEAAASLGLGYWRTTVLIVLPQALRIVIPPLVNTFIEVFKDTTLVIIVGLFDLLNTTRTAILDIEWRPYYAEAYLFAALIYFFFCFLMSRISLLLEHCMGRATRR
jgi:general L-amino acid transport system permease protein